MLWGAISWILGLKMMVTPPQMFHVEHLGKMLDGKRRRRGDNRMDFDFSPFFNKYEALLAVVDATFDRIKKEYPHGVTCTLKCADCCHAIFDLSLMEALYINHQFNRRFQGKARERILEKANRADRKAFQIKKKAANDREAGKSETEILVELAAERIRCPLLNEKETCELYPFRPVTCRLYGLPTAIGGISHTCGRSGFYEGKAYPTVNLETVQRKLFALSAEIVQALQTRYPKLHEMLVPLSMALLTDYDAQYLGVGTDPSEENKEGRKG